MTPEFLDDVKKSQSAFYFKVESYSILEFVSECRLAVLQWTLMKCHHCLDKSITKINLNLQRFASILSLSAIRNLLGFQTAFLVRYRVRPQFAVFGCGADDRDTDGKYLRVLSAKTSLSIFFSACLRVRKWSTTNSIMCNGFPHDSIFLNQNKSQTFKPDLLPKSLRTHLIKCISEYSWII